MSTAQPSSLTFPILIPHHTKCPSRSFTQPFLLAMTFHDGPSSLKATTKSFTNLKSPTQLYSDTEAYLINPVTPQDDFEHQPQDDFEHQPLDVTVFSEHPKILNTNH